LGGLVVRAVASICSKSQKVRASLAFGQKVPRTRKEPGYLCMFPM
jgi:hypothetical protein